MCVCDERIFLSVLKQRLLEKYNQEWLNAVNNSSRFSFYVTFKSSLLPEQYFDCVCASSARIKSTCVCSLARTSCLDRFLTKPKPESL